MNITDTVSFELRPSLRSTRVWTMRVSTPDRRDGVQLRLVLNRGRMESTMQKQIADFSKPTGSHILGSVILRLLHIKQGGSDFMTMGYSNLPIPVHLTPELSVWKKEGTYSAVLKPVVCTSSQTDKQSHPTGHIP